MLKSNSQTAEVPVFVAFYFLGSDISDEFLYNMESKTMMETRINQFIWVTDYRYAVSNVEKFYRFFFCGFSVTTFFPEKNNRLNQNQNSCWENFGLSTRVTFDSAKNLCIRVSLNLLSDDKDDKKSPDSKSINRAKF